MARPRRAVSARLRLLQQLLLHGGRDRLDDLDEYRVDLTEAQAVLALLTALRGARPKPAAHALADLVQRRGLEGSSEASIRWAS